MPLTEPALENDSVKALLKDLVQIHLHLTKRTRAVCPTFILRETLLLATTCILALSCPAIGAEPSTKLFRAPIEIETVFPATVIRKSELTELEQAGDGYEFWGKEVVTQSHVPIHFSTPVSYPWEYSEEGARRLVESLKKLTNVQSANVEQFPSIYPRDLKSYPDLIPFSKQERIIRVTLKDWPNVQLLSFPTLAVLLFNYQDPNLPYSKVVEDWKKTIKAFHQLHELRELLGLEPMLKWQTIPRLT